MCFSELLSLTFDFQKCRVCTLCLIKMITLYSKIDNSATDIHLIDFSYVKYSDIRN